MNAAPTPAQQPAPKLSLVITRADYFMGRDKLPLYRSELSDQLQVNADNTIRAVNDLLKACGIPTYVSSGWRPKAINAATKGAAPLSNHTICQACDLHDPEGRIDAYCYSHQDVLAKLGLWLEHPAHTPGWCHVQTLPPRSGHRVFIP